MGLWCFVPDKWLQNPSLEFSNVPHRGSFRLDSLQTSKRKIVLICLQAQAN